MGVEVIPAEVRKAGDICLGDGAFVGDHGVAYLQLFEIFAEGVFVFHRLPGMGLPVIGEGGDHSR